MRQRSIAKYYWKNRESPPLSTPHFSHIPNHAPARMDIALKFGDLGCLTDVFFFIFIVILVTPSPLYDQRNYPN